MSVDIHPEEVPAVELILSTQLMAIFHKNTSLAVCMGWDFGKVNARQRWKGLCASINVVP